MSPSASHSVANALTETARLVRAALERLQGRPVLITTADDLPVTSGTLVVVEGLDGPVMPSLSMEFSMRGIVFVMEIPLERVFRLVSSWNGRHFAFRLPPDARLHVETRG